MPTVMMSEAPTIQKRKLKAVISGVGPDRPGIVAEITRILLRHQANIEDSTMTLLANEFAVILIVTLSEDSPLESLEQDLYKMEEAGRMTFTIKPLDEQDQAAPYTLDTRPPFLISVAGDDRTGITYHVSQELAKLNINITDLNAQVIPGDEGAIYIMMVEVQLPDGVNPEQVEKALRSTESGKELEISIRSLEGVAL